MVPAFLHPSSDFLRFTENFGKPVTIDPSIYNEYIKPGLEKACEGWQFSRSKNSVGFTLNVEFGMVEKKDIPNAFCGFKNGKHFIVIDHLLPIIFLEFFHRLMANPGHLKGLGNVELDQNNKINNLQRPPGFSILQGEINVTDLIDVEEKFGSNCPIRRQAARLLYNDAMAFIWSHEITHAVAGHVHYIEKYYAADFINEAEINSINNLDADTVLSYFETIADKGAIWSVVGRSFLFRQRLLDDELILHATFSMLAISFVPVFFMLLDVYETKADQHAIYRWGDHPSNISRAMQATLFPVAQAGIIGGRIAKVMEQASLNARMELLRMAAENPMYRPFNWLKRDNMLESLLYPFVISAETKTKVDDRLKDFLYNISS